MRLKTNSIHIKSRPTNRRTKVLRFHDKAANPVNMMGASKRLMEKFLVLESKKLDISPLGLQMLHFQMVHYCTASRILLNRQPISAPNDVTRYFVSPQEAGVLCLFLLPVKICRRFSR